MGICGREHEIKEIHNFVSSRIQSKQSGILYLTGPPGTGKTMSVGLVLEKFKDILQIRINCIRAASSKSILSKLIDSLDLHSITKYNECEMIERISKKLTGRTAKACLLVLDELDQLPRSKNANLIRTIFSWPSQPNSRLILIGIANAVNLTSRYQVVSSLVGRNDSLTKVLFRPYNSTQIKAILEWYLENDENFEDELVEPKALEMISKKFARENGDIRGALNALKSSIDDSKQHKMEPENVHQFPTPPSTPPPSPCKEKTNLASVANSCKKRQKVTSYKGDTTPFAHQVLLASIFKVCTMTKNNTINARTCKDFVRKALRHYDITVPDIEYMTMLETLELQGLITVRKGRPMGSIVLKASEAEIISLTARSDKLLDTLNEII